MVQDRAYAATYDANTMKYGPSPTILQSEMSAFSVGDRVKRYDFHGLSMENFIKGRYGRWAEPAW